MNGMQIFENPDFGFVRTLEIDGRPYFVANDVAKALGYAKPANAVAAHCKGILKTGIPSERGTQETNIIPLSLSHSCRRQRSLSSGYLMKSFPLSANTAHT